MENRIHVVEETGRIEAAEKPSSDWKLREMQLGPS